MFFENLQESRPIFNLYYNLTFKTTLSDDVSTPFTLKQLNIEVQPMRIRVLAGNLHFNAQTESALVHFLSISLSAIYILYK